MQVEVKFLVSFIFINFEKCDAVRNGTAKAIVVFLFWTIFRYPVAGIVNSAIQFVECAGIASYHIFGCFTSCLNQFCRNLITTCRFTRSNFAIAKSTRYKWFSCMYFYLPNVTDSMHIQQLRKVILPPI
jgi:hypothetical protein